MPAAKPVPPVVHFDNCSLPSGIQRGYIICTWPDHDMCKKHMQINVAGSRERLIAYLSAWNLCGEGLPRELHSGGEPPEHLVEEQLRLLFPS